MRNFALPLLSALVILPASADQATVEVTHLNDTNKTTSFSLPVSEKGESEKSLDLECLLGGKKVSSFFYFSKSKISLLYTYKSPQVTTPTKQSISTKPNHPSALKLTAHGYINTISTSKRTKRMATKK